jgi:trimeric autotransporter adhesin
MKFERLARSAGEVCDAANRLVIAQSLFRAPIIDGATLATSNRDSVSDSRLTAAATSAASFAPCAARSAASVAPRAATSAASFATCAARSAASVAPLAARSAASLAPCAARSAASLAPCAARSAAPLAALAATMAADTAAIAATKAAKTVASIEGSDAIVEVSHSGISVPVQPGVYQSTIRRKARCSSRDTPCF